MKIVFFFFGLYFNKWSKEQNSKLGPNYDCYEPKDKQIGKIEVELVDALHFKHV